VGETIWSLASVVGRLLAGLDFGAQAAPVTSPANTSGMTKAMNRLRVVPRRRHGRRSSTPAVAATTAVVAASVPVHGRECADAVPGMAASAVPAPAARARR